MTLQLPTRDRSNDEAITKRVLTLRDFPNRPGYTPRIGETMTFMTVDQAEEEIVKLTAQGLSWNSQPHADGVYISHNGQTFGAKLDHKLTAGNLYWQAKAKGARLVSDIKAMEDDLAFGFDAMKAEVENEDPALRDALHEEIAERRENTERRLPWTKGEKVTADGDARSFHDRAVSPTLTLKENVAAWVRNNLDHAVHLAGTFREPTIRFMSGKDRDAFVAKWGGVRLEG